MASYALQRHLGWRTQSRLGQLPSQAWQCCASASVEKQVIGEEEEGRKKNRVFKRTLYEGGHNKANKNH